MNILFLTYGLPYPPDRGARIRDYHFLRYLSRSHQILLLSLLDPTGQEADLTELREYCSQIETVGIPQRSAMQQIRAFLDNLIYGRPLAVQDFYHQEVAEKLQDLICAHEVDIIQIEHSFFAPYVHDLPGKRHLKTVLDFHNISYQQYRRISSISTGIFDKAIALAKSLLMRRLESRYASLFDHCLVTSEIEAALLSELNPETTLTVIPNGVDSKALQPVETPANENTLLLIGTIGYPPNEDSVFYFCSHILPLIEEKVPDIKLLVVGHAPSKNVRKFDGRRNIRVVGSVPDVLPYYQRSSVQVVPLRAGGGTRLKILESMAYGVPVVSTSIGCEGLAVSDGEQLLIADTPQQFANRVIQLLQDQTLRDHLTWNARQLVENTYDWENLTFSLDRIYHKISI